MNTNENKDNFLTKAALIGGSFLFVFLLLGVGELYCRLFTRIQFLGNSANLFVKQRFGESIGNLVNGKAVSFQVNVFTDENGFRIDPSTPDPQADRAVLFLGDSVGFGSGVEEPETTVGRLRNALDALRLYNSSCIGYNTRNYIDVARHFLPSHSDVRAIYVLMCLNDIGSVNAINILKSTGKDPEKQIPQDLVVRTKKYRLLNSINEYLREHSMLFLLVKNTLSDTSQRYFLYDLEIYKESETYFGEAMSSLKELKDLATSHGSSLKVFILPYEYQLRTSKPEHLLPQRMITTYLKEHGIDYLDVYQTYKESGVPSKDLFLFADPMHFSTKGHEILAHVLREDIDARLRDGDHDGEQEPRREKTI